MVTGFRVSQIFLYMCTKSPWSKFGVSNIRHLTVVLNPTAKTKIRISAHSTAADVFLPIFILSVFIKFFDEYGERGGNAESQREAERIVTSQHYKKICGHGYRENYNIGF